MREVVAGRDSLLSVDPSDGSLSFSPVIAFLDRDEEEERGFVTISVEGGRDLTLTPTHLVYVAKKDMQEEEEEGREEDMGDNELDSDLSDAPSDFSSKYDAFYAGDVRPGDRVLVRSSGGASLRPARVASVSLGRRRGVYAPLTARGNLVVDGVAASCYAVVDSQAVAHAAFWPYRAARWAEGLFVDAVEDPPLKGVNWYASWLYWLAEKVMPSHLR